MIVDRTTLCTFRGKRQINQSLHPVKETRSPLLRSSSHLFPRPITRRTIEGRTGECNVRLYLPSTINVAGRKGQSRRRQSSHSSSFPPTAVLQQRGQGFKPDKKRFPSNKYFPFVLLFALNCFNWKRAFRSKYPFFVGSERTQKAPLFLLALLSVCHAH